jgi:transcriptional regulator with XRE-family HTH domain
MAQKHKTTPKRGRKPRPLPPLARALTASREASGKSQEAVGLEIGVTQPTISNWEHGRQNPERKYWRSIIRVYGVEMDLFLPEDGKGKASKS